MNNLEDFPECDKWLDGVAFDSDDLTRHEMIVNAEEVQDRLIVLNTKILELQDFCIWLTGCGYDFTQHKYFNEQRDKLLK